MVIELFKNLCDFVTEKGYIEFLKSMQNHYLIICLIELFAIVNCGLLMNHLPAILQEFKISHPILANRILPVEKTTKLLKILSHHGYSISILGQIEDINRQYQSYLIFSKIDEFHWNFRTDAPSLILTEIQNETDLNQVEVAIGNEVLFLDMNSMKVYEAYNVNQINIIRYLGFFQETVESTMKFLPSKDYNPSMVKRRKNFHGLLFKGITGTNVENSSNYPTNVEYYSNNDTYDITNLMNTDPDIFWAPTLIPVLQILQTQLNFTFRFFARKDQKLGSPKLLSNGSISLSDGMFKDLKDGDVDIMMILLTILPVRSEIVDYLPPLVGDYVAIFIPNELEEEVIDWIVFFDPFSYQLWTFITIKCIIFVLLVYLIEWLHDVKMVTRKLISY